jgi:hypothetical protein
MTFGKTSPRAGVSRVVFALSLGLLGALGGGSGCGGSNDPRPATWKFVSTAILEPSCATANCHSAIAARAGVDLSDRTVGFKSLVTRRFVISKEAAPTLTDDQRVERSAVPNLMRAVGNLRMPPDLPLPEPDIFLFENWIRAGAADD